MAEGVRDCFEGDVGGLRMARLRCSVQMALRDGKDFL